MSNNDKGHFGGTVTKMDAKTATIKIETVWNAFNVAAGDVVTALRSDFMKQMPMPSVDAYVEGNVVKDDKGQIQFTNIVRPV